MCHSIAAVVFSPCFMLFNIVVAVGDPDQQETEQSSITRTKAKTFIRLWVGRRRVAHHASPAQPATGVRVR